MGSAGGQSKRFAFLLGNAAYAHISPLRNPANDIAAVARELRSLDYDVSEYTNLDWNNTCHRIGELANKAGKCEAIVVYYSGHGVQLRGSNYIVPIDFDPSTPVDLDVEAGLIPIDAVMTMVGQASKRLIFLDACRDDGGLLNRTRIREQVEAAPSGGTPTQQGTEATRGLVARKGLARQELGTGSQTFICFAADPGDVARDGEGDISPFTRAVMAHIGLRGLDAFDFSQRIARDVRAATDGRQVPWTNSNLSEGFSFNPANDCPMWILGALGGFAGLLTAATSLNVFEKSWPIRFTSNLRLHDVTLDPKFLLTSLLFGIVLGLGAYFWGKRAWYVPILTCLGYALFTTFARLWFAPYAAQGDTHQLLAKVKFSNFIGASATSCSERELLYTVLFATSLMGTASVLAGAPWVRDLAKLPRIAAGTFLGACACFLMLAFFKGRDYVNWILSGGAANSGGNADFYWLEPLAVLLLFIVWHAALALNVGYAYSRPRYD